ncbi:hypothetical protein IFM89_039321 [Coptis chinensis]|uniref:Uncharacterized protein n=1 Tax=Coptis chinensis TaxID=261450 RepID=A0A835LT65_9MAGN|nr:hypothetical protein IFM89_039321 [Coptis chinensis]
MCRFVFPDEFVATKLDIAKMAVESSRKQNVYMAKLAGRAGRHEEMLKSKIESELDKIYNGLLKVLWSLIPVDIATQVPVAFLGLENNNSTPTKQIATLNMKVFRVSKSISHHARFRSTMVSGGGRLRPQEDSLNVPIDMVVGTPGRVLQHIEEGNITYVEIKSIITKNL